MSSAEPIALGVPDEEGREESPGPALVAPSTPEPAVEAGAAKPGEPAEEESPPAAASPAAASPAAAESAEEAAGAPASSPAAGAPAEGVVPSERRGGRPAGGTKLFLGGLSWSTKEEDIRRHFSGYGDIHNVVVMVDRMTLKPRGFAFCTVADEETADRICQDSHVLDGRTIDAKRSVPQEQKKSKKIFVGGLASDTSQDQFREHFSQFGTVTDAQIMQDHTSMRSRGFGFITFEEEDAVDRVFTAGTLQEVGGKRVEVKTATPRGAGGPRGPASTVQAARGASQSAPASREGHGLSQAGAAGGRHSAAAAAAAYGAQAQYAHPAVFGQQQDYSMLYSQAPPYGMYGSGLLVSSQQYSQQYAQYAAAQYAYLGQRGQAFAAQQPVLHGQQPQLQQALQQQQVQPQPQQLGQQAGLQQQSSLGLASSLGSPFGGSPHSSVRLQSHGSGRVSIRQR